MVRTRKSFRISQISFMDTKTVGNKLVVDFREVLATQERVNKLTPSQRMEISYHVPTSNIGVVGENRIFRQYADLTPKEEELTTVLTDENGEAVLDLDGNPIMNTALYYDATGLFCNINFKYKAPKYLRTKKAKKQHKAQFKSRFKHFQQKGLTVILPDGTEVDFKRVTRSPSQVRTLNMTATSLDPEQVRETISFGAIREFGKYTNVAKAEARIASGGSSSLQVDDEIFTFDVLPDFKITRSHPTIVVGETVEHFDSLEDDYNPLDGQGTILPSAAVRAVNKIGILNDFEADYLLDALAWANEDFFMLLDLSASEIMNLSQTEDIDLYDFATLWAKVPEALQSRFALCKGLLLVFPHNLPQYNQDCNNAKGRSEGDVMDYWKKNDGVDENGYHEYDFSSDILFTDSQWKGNFDSKYLLGADSDVPKRQRVHLEILLFSQEAKHTVNMGYQYWQSLKGFDITKKSQAIIDTLDTEILRDPSRALEFLGAVNVDEESMSGMLEQEVISGTDKARLSIMSDSRMLLDSKNQKTIKDTAKKLVENMRDRARIPVAGCNPYIISDPVVMFGLPSILAEDTAYFANKTGEVVLMRSPQMIENEVVKGNLVRKKFYRHYKQVLILNVYSDWLPRMGGADTDGDRVALIFDKDIVASAPTGLPMVINSGLNAEKTEYNVQALHRYDALTIMPEEEGASDFKNVGTITNYSTFWKEIAYSKKAMKRFHTTQEQIQDNLYELAGKQGITIDFPKTGINVPPSEEAVMEVQPAWQKKAREDVYVETYEGEKLVAVYVPESSLQQNFDFLDDYLKNEFMEIMEYKPADTVDFNILFSEKTVLAEREVLRPIITSLESQYRSAIRNIGMTFEDEDQRMEAIIAVIEQHRTVINALPFSIEAIAAIAYDVCYSSTSAHGTHGSYVWHVAFEGLMILLEGSKHTTRLVSIRTAFPVEQLPKTLIVDNREAFLTDRKGRDYVAKVAVPDGKYKVFVSQGKAYVKAVSPSIIDTLTAREQLRRSANVDVTLPLQINGFGHYEATSHDVIADLQASKGLIRIEKVELELADGTPRETFAIIADEYHVASIGARYVSMITPFMNGDESCEFQVVGYENLEATYLKDDKEMPHKFYDISLVVASKDGSNDEDLRTRLIEAFEEDFEEIKEAEKKAEKKRRQQKQSADNYVDYDSYDSYNHAPDMDSYANSYDEASMPSYADYDDSYADYSTASSDVVEYDMDDEEEEDDTEAFEMLSPAYEEVVAKASKKYQADVSALYGKIAGFNVEDGVLSMYREKNGELVALVIEFTRAKNGTLKFAKDLGDQLTILSAQLIQYFYKA